MIVTARLGRVEGKGLDMGFHVTNNEIIIRGECGVEVRAPWILHEPNGRATVKRLIEELDAKLRAKES